MMPQRRTTSPSVGAIAGKRHEASPRRSTSDADGAATGAMASLFSLLGACTPTMACFGVLLLVGSLGFRVVETRSAIDSVYATVWTHPCHICAGTGPTPATSTPGLRSPRSHLRRGWAHLATSAPGLGSPRSHLHQDWGSGGDCDERGHRRTAELVGRADMDRGAQLELDGGRRPRYRGRLSVAPEAGRFAP